MKACARAILVSDKPWGVDFGNVAGIFSLSDDLGIYMRCKTRIHPPSLDALLLCVAPGGPLGRIS